MPITFEILLDNQYGSYFPGELVSGKVFIRANSEKNTQGLKLKFEGKAVVHWEEEHVESSGTADNKTDRKVTKSFDDSDTFFEFKSYLLGDGRSDVKIPAGDSHYPFSFQLPQMNLPSSYLGHYGKVEYTLEAEVKRSWKFDYTTKRQITVNAIVDLNNDPEAVQPGEWTTSKTFCCLCCATGPLTMNIRLKTKGYCPGEIIPLEVEINNLSTRVISDISYEFAQEATFFAQSDKNTAYKALQSKHRGEGVPAGETDIWREEIIVPPVPPTKLGGCRLIDVKYVLKITAHVTGAALNLKHDCPIIIGTVPLKARFDELRPKENIHSPSAPPLFAPNGHTDLPMPQFLQSHNFSIDPLEKPGLVENIANTVIDSVVPTVPDYVPTYPTYGWRLPVVDAAIASQ